MTATCGTLCAAAKILREKGAVSIRAAVTHVPLTEKGIQRLKGETGLTELVMTDTIPLREDVLTAGLPTKVTVLSVAGLLGEAIRRIHENQSVSKLFRH